jgi:hypothetical protein
MKATINAGSIADGVSGTSQNGSSSYNWSGSISRDGSFITGIGMLLQYNLLPASLAREASMSARLDKKSSLVKEERDLWKVPIFPFVATFNLECIDR